MTKEEMLSAIYDEMADKTLSEWCKYITDIYKCTIRYSDVVQPDNVLYSKENDDFYRIDTIIWHPVCINDCINTIYVYNNWDINIIKDICDLWINKLCPIEQCWNDKCIDYLYNYIENVRGNG